MLYRVVALVVSTLPAAVAPKPSRVAPQFKAGSAEEVYEKGDDETPDSGLFPEWLERTDLTLAPGEEPVVTELDPETGKPLAASDEDRMRDAFDALTLERDRAVAKLEELSKGGLEEKLAEAEKALDERTAELNAALAEKAGLLEELKRLRSAAPPSDGETPAQS